MSAAAIADSIDNELNKVIGRLSNPYFNTDEVKSYIIDELDTRIASKNLMILLRSLRNGLQIKNAFHLQ